MPVGWMKLRGFELPQQVPSCLSRENPSHPFLSWRECLYNVYVFLQCCLLLNDSLAVRGLYEWNLWENYKLNRNHFWAFPELCHNISEPYWRGASAPAQERWGIYAPRFLPAACSPSLTSPSLFSAAFTRAPSQTTSSTSSTRAPSLDPWASLSPSPRRSVKSETEDFLSMSSNKPNSQMQVSSDKLIVKNLFNFGLLSTYLY